MAIRKVISRSIEDATIAAADIANTTITGAKLASGAGGVGFFSGENGNRGDTTDGKGDIFRVHETTLNTSVTIASGDNALAAGPLTVSTSGTVNLTVNGNLTIV
jgi:hypothetical protein